MTDQETEQLFGHFGVILTIAQDHVVAEAACVRFYAEREFGIERIGHLGNDQPMTLVLLQIRLRASALTR